MLKSACNIPIRFYRARRGNVAVMFALTLVPMLMVVGCAVDYARATFLRSKLQTAIDSASISSVSRSSPGYAQAARMTSNGTLNEGIDDALNIFKGNIADLSGYQGQTISAVVSKTAATITSELAFTANVPTSFLGIMGFSNLEITGASKAEATLPSYIDFYLLLDNSPSMGVAATAADVKKMEDAIGCAFACHDLSKKVNNYTIAKSLGVQTRIDILGAATVQLMNTAVSTRTLTDQFRMAIYDFGATAATTDLRLLYKLSSDLPAAKMAAGNLALMTIAREHELGDQQTNFTTILPKLSDDIGYAGNGTAESPQKYVFFVSDGVADEANKNCLKPTYGASRCQSPINPALCKAFKDKGIKVAVLYTTYLVLPDTPENYWYYDWIHPFNLSSGSEIAKNMQACASPGFYFEVSMKDGISEAMNALFHKAINDARISS